MLEYIAEADNNYFYKKKVGDIDYYLQYRPTDIMVSQELRDDTDPEKIKKLREKYKKYMYFNLSMSKNNQEVLNEAAGDQQRFSQMVNDLVFGLGDKVHLYTPKKDTLSMTDFVYPRMYGVSKSTTILFVYPREKEILNHEYLNFTIEDFGLSTGEVKFKINTKAIQNEPNINF